MDAKRSKVPPDLVLFRWLFGLAVLCFVVSGFVLSFLLKFEEWLRHGLGWRELVAIAAHLPFHELRECALGTRTKLLVAALLGNRSIGAEYDDGVGALDC